MKPAASTQLTLSRILVLVLCFSILGCAHQIDNDVDSTSQHPFYGQVNGEGDLFTQQSVPSNVFASRSYCVDRETFAAPLNYRVDKPILGNAPSQVPFAANANFTPTTLPLSPGDMIDVMIENGEGFNGRYVLDNNGLLIMPIIQPISATGVSAKID